MAVGVGVSTSMRLQLDLEERVLAFFLRLFIVFLVVGSFCVVQFMIVPQFLGASFVGVVFSLLYDAVVALILSNYYLACFRSPGVVTADYEPDFDASGIPSEEANQLYRYCRKCGVHKPPRSHHCSTSKRCVLKMDHYCPWVGNVVGHHNHKFFVLFLFYVIVASAMQGVLMIARAASTTPCPKYLMVSMVVTEFLVVPMTFGVIMLFIFQVMLVVRNLTTIESYDYDSRKMRAEHDGRRFAYLYDYGVMDNMRVTFGRDWRKWFLPTATEHDGVHWRVVCDEKVYMV